MNQQHQLNHQQQHQQQQQSNNNNSNQLPTIHLLGGTGNSSCSPPALKLEFSSTGQTLGDQLLGVTGSSSSSSSSSSTSSNQHPHLHNHHQTTTAASNPEHQALLLAAAANSQLGAQLVAAGSPPTSVSSSTASSSSAHSVVQLATSGVLNSSSSSSSSSNSSSSSSHSPSSLVSLVGPGATNLNSNVGVASGSLASTSSSSGDGSPPSVLTDVNHNELPLFLRQLKSYIQDDKVWQAQLFDLLNNHTYNQVEVDLFELMCSVIERSLFAQVDWARNSIFFRDLQVSFQFSLVHLTSFIM